MSLKVFNKYLIILVLMFGSFSVSADVLNEQEEKKLLDSNPKIIASIATNRSLQFWFLVPNGKGIVWCETFVNEDKASTETICFDDIDPDD